jgi:RNase H-fold protein (predicted Holliday junction resolvase)
MSENNRNTAGKPEEFLRYRSKRMAAKEKNDFERHLQKDPFAEEAAEGFENIDPGQAEKDLLMLQKRLSKRTSGHRIPWYGIAASVAVLMVIVTVLVLMNKKEPAEIAYVPSAQNKVEEKKPEVEEIVVQPAMKIPENVSVRTREKTAKEVVQQKTEAEIPVSDEVISADNAREEVKPVEGLKMATEP